jgi:acyl-CoA thioesterase FadM
LLKIGSKSITVRYEMNNLGRNELAATFECIYVLFDMKARKGLVLTDDLRAMAVQHLDPSPH